MKYYLTLDGQNYKKGIDNYHIIDYSDSTELEDILDFTTSFYCEEELKNYIYNKGLVDKDFIKKPIKILSVDKDENYTALKYDVPYADDKKYYTLSSIGDYLIKNSKDKNLYLEFYHAFKTKASIGHYAEIFRELYHYIMTMDHYDPFDNIDLDTLIREMVFIIGKNKNNNVNFGALHKMAMIIINNERKKERKNDKEKLESTQRRLLHIRELIKQGDLLPEELVALEKEEYRIMLETNNMEVEEYDKSTGTKNSR